MLNFISKLIQADFYLGNKETYKEHIEEFKEIVSRREAERENAAVFLAMISKTAHKFGFTEAAVSAVNAAHELSPGNETVIKIKEDIDSRHTLLNQAKSDRYAYFLF